MKKILILSLFFFIAGRGICDYVALYHTVKKGENLYIIAKKYGTSVNNLKRLNNIKSSVILPGQKLLVKKIHRKTSREKISFAKRTSQKSAVWGYRTVYYRVKRGDSLWKISKKFGVSVKEIKKWNKLRSSIIRPGEKIKIKIPKKPPKIKNPKPIMNVSAKVYYTVKKGDTIESVAKKFGITPEELKEANLITESDFKVGQILVIPPKRILSEQKHTETEIEKEGNLRSEVVEEALSYINVPYKLGGASKKKGVDCSSFIQLVYKKFGFELPRTSYYQYKQGICIKLEDAEPGDLVFFRRGRYVGHVGIYLGNNLFIHASDKQKRVTISSLEKPYFKKHFVCVKRILPSDENLIAW
ncbi:LysM peptidoglycan-binding domain-containing protein, partial [bacterium]|nr:LysM peptidoglycan-binding domain-containing protein [bacterium]